MYRHAWHAGLKTTYYLRSFGASNIEKATVAVKKEVRGVTGDAGRQVVADKAAAAAAAAEVTTAPFTLSPAAPAASSTTLSAVKRASAPKKQYTEKQKSACSIEAMRNGGECEACQ